MRQIGEAVILAGPQWRPLAGQSQVNQTGASKAIVTLYLAFHPVGQELILGRFAVLGVDSPDGFETKGIAMIQATQCPDSWRALTGKQEIGARFPVRDWGEYSSSYTSHLAPRSRQTADASTGGQHGRP